MAKLTFGKYQGYETEDLAKFSDGRAYLAWGIQKLDSPKWRAEFERVLTLPVAIDIDREAESIMAGDAQIDPRAAYGLAKNYAAQLLVEEKADELKTTAEAELKAALVAAGMDARQVKAIVNLIGSEPAERLAEAEKYGRIRFKNPERRQKVWQAVIELMAGWKISLASIIFRR